MIGMGSSTFGWCCARGNRAEVRLFGTVTISRDEGRSAGVGASVVCIRACLSRYCHIGVTYGEFFFSVSY
jgi:hypothetical protein